MVRKRIHLIIALSMLTVLAGGLMLFKPGVVSLVAGETPKKGTEAPEKPPVKQEKKEADEKERLSVTYHSININGSILKYTATAGLMPLKDASGKLKAHIFYTAYVKDASTVSVRPIAFVFNGGPGAASIWLHLGCAGPKRVLLRPNSRGLVAPYQWVQNEYTWLDETDLVFVDPVGTGYSEPADGVEGKEFYGVEEDIRWIAEFIRLYCTRNGRWLSPKLLIGESYGTTRAVGLSGYLQGKTGLNMNGIVLISTVLDFQTIMFAPGNDMPYVLYLPAYAETALYHKRLAPGLQSDRGRTRREVEEFAVTEYLTGLVKGSSLTKKERDAMVERLASFTGLDRTFIENSNLRINRDDFIRELLRGKNLRVGLLDSRVTADYRPTTFIEDPSVFQIAGPLVAVFNDYVRKELGYFNDVPYEFLAEKPNREWKWGPSSRGYLNVAPTLSRAIKENKSLKVFIGSGYYDLDTSYFAAKYVVNQLGLEQSLLANVSMAYYDAGHMMYSDMTSLKKLKADVTVFIRNAVSIVPDD